METNNAVAFWLWPIILGFLLVAPQGNRPGGSLIPPQGSRPADPPVAPTMGFFLDDWQSRTFVVPKYAGAAASQTSAGSSRVSAGIDTITVDATDIITKIPPSEFGQNANTWMTAMITEPAFMHHVGNLHPHIIRWPAGSGSDAYFWDRPPGSLPADVPKMLLDKNGKEKYPGFFFGKTSGTRSASLFDYYEMLRMTGNEGLITINYGYARYGTGPDPVANAAHYAADWVRYDHGRTRYWEIGNENFGDWELGYRIDTTKNKDGQPQFLTGQLYAKHFKIFADSMKKAAAETGATIYIGAVTFETSPMFWQTPTVKTWNSGMMKELNNQADYYVVHNYFTPYNKNSSAADILYNADTVPAAQMAFVTKTLAANGAGLKPIAMDEWNMFATGSSQQVSNVSGVFAVIVMGESLTNKYGLAARWDMFNAWDGGNDHGLFSAGDEPGIPRWNPRPSFYYLYFLQKMVGDRLVNTSVRSGTGLRAYGSTFTSGEVNLTVANTSAKPRMITVDLRHFAAGDRYYWYSLEGGDDNGEFSRRVFVNGHGPAVAAGGPDDYADIPAWSASTSKGLVITVPARGAVVLTIDKR
jgi:hypothetical protein